LGEHTVEVLHGIGCSDNEIGELEQTGIVRVSHWDSAAAKP